MYGVIFQIVTKVVEVVRCTKLGLRLFMNNLEDFASVKIKLMRHVTPKVVLVSLKAYKTFSLAFSKVNSTEIVNI